MPNNCEWVYGQRPEPMRECEVETLDGATHIGIMLFRDQENWCNRSEGGSLFEYALTYPVIRWRYITGR